LKISIVITTYGEAHWEDMAKTRALPSAESQGAYEVIQGHRSRLSIARARNSLAKKAKGDWLLFLDADDQLSQGYVASMQRALKRSRTEKILLTPAVSYWYPGHRIPRPPVFLAGHDLRQGNYLVLGTVLPRDLFFEVGGFSDYPHGYEDWSIWAKCWKAGAEIVQVRRAVYIAHVNRESKHRVMWRDHEYQTRMHDQIRRDLFPEEYV
jgi:glycosyltransferase involved in cell wall biosynthesis